MASAILADTGQAKEFFETDGRRERREPTMTIVGSGPRDADVPTVDVLRSVVDDDPTLIVTDGAELTVVRSLAGGNRRTGATLAGTWNGQPVPQILAYASPR